MFEFERASKRFHYPFTSASPAQAQLPNAHERALLFWGEHCIECAAPACYATCDLYSPTPAGKCRRFDHGIVPNPSARTEHGPAAEVRFKRWGKLEARGHATLGSARRVDVFERVLHSCSRIARFVSPAIAKVTNDNRWLTPMEALHKRIHAWLQNRQRDDNLPDALHAEIVNLEDQPTELILTVFIDKTRLKRTIGSEQLPHPIAIKLALAPGTSTHRIPCEAMRDIFLSRLPFNISLTPVNDRTPHLIFRRLELVGYGKSAGAQTAPTSRPTTAPAVKCVVFDLDNTLWDGILLEGNIRLRAEARKLFSYLDERGILISIASKNARQDALSKLQEFGLLDYVVHPQIGWLPKSQSLQQIVKALNIGRDTFIFIDDNPFERAEVAQALPGVEVLSDSEIPALSRHPRLQGAITAESRSRRKMYQEAAQREETAASYGDDYIEFLRSCEMVVTIRPDTADDLDRICELVQRTNQLNFSGRKYGRDEISAILKSDQERVVVICSDRFGSYGTVGFCLYRREAMKVVVDDFMLSCRVQGKFVEQALFYYLTKLSGGTAIEINFKKTERNRAAEMVLEKLGFRFDGNAARRCITNGDFRADFMKLNFDEA